MPDLSNNQQLLQNAGARVPVHGVLVVFRAEAVGEQAPSLHPILPWLSIVCPSVLQIHTEGCSVVCLAIHYEFGGT